MKTIITVSEKATDYIEDDATKLIKDLESDKIIVAYPLTASGFISGGVYHVSIGHVDDEEVLDLSCDDDSLKEAGENGL